MLRPLFQSSAPGLLLVSPKCSGLIEIAMYIGNSELGGFPNNSDAEGQVSASTYVPQAGPD